MLMSIEVNYEIIAIARAHEGCVCVRSHYNVDEHLSANVSSSFKESN